MTKKIKRIKKRKLLLGIVVLAFLILMVPVVVRLAQFNHEIRSDAVANNNPNSPSVNRGCGAGSSNGDKMCGNNSIYICRNGSWILGMNCGRSNMDCVANGSSVTCKKKKVDGVCGTSNNTCKTGRFSNVLDNRSYYLWKCNGLNGGRTASCRLKK